MVAFIRHIICTHSRQVHKILIEPLRQHLNARAGTVSDLSSRTKKYARKPAPRPGNPCTHTISHAGSMGQLMSRVKGIYLLIIMTLLYSMPSLNAQTYKINKYGLKLIKDREGYQAQIKMDPDLQLLPLDSLIGDLKTAFVYATRDNFTHTVLYQHPRPYLRRPAALALQKVAAQFRQLGYGLLIYDAYRPYSVTEKMWQVVPDNRYAADPRHGSGHNKGISVDVSLYDLHTGKAIPMPTGFDDFTNKAHQGFQNLPENILKNRALLKKRMEAGGFTPLSTEWWHFSYTGKTAKGTYYMLMDLNFDTLAGLKN